jgi:hypothetical protein
MGWYGWQRGEDFSEAFHLGGKELLVADGDLDLFKASFLLEAFPPASRARCNW